MSFDEVFEGNLKINYSEIQNRKVHLSSKPIKLNVALTTECNLFCLMCVVRKIPWQIPTDVIREIIFLFPYLQEIVWQGGEVFLLDYFEEVLEEASLYPNLTHEITTNGHFISEDWLKILSRLNLSLNVSIDGITKGTYEYIRRGSKFEALIKALNLINERRENWGPGKLTLVLIVTVMRSNYRELEGLLEFAKKYNFDKIILQPVKANIDNGENIFFYNEEKIFEYIDGVKRRTKKEAAALNIKLVEWLPTTSSRTKSDAFRGGISEKQMPLSHGRLFCYAPWQQMFIEWGGDVYPHCHCIQEGCNESKVVGDVSSESLADIWNGEKMQNFRTKISNGDYYNLCNPDCFDDLITTDMRDVPIKGL